MKAITCRKYGSADVFTLEKLNQPVPKENEILIQIHCTAVNSADWRLRKPDPALARLFFGWFKPRNPVLGGVLSGVVVSIGSKVTKFVPGDKVFGSTGMSFGAYAEYKCLKESEVLSLLPSGFSHKEAAALPFGSLTALHFLQRAELKQSQKILIYGASGSVGTFAVQIAKYYGADVTVVSSKANHELLKSIGADHTMDYEEMKTNKQQLYDVIFEAVGKSSLKFHLPYLVPQGRLILGSSSFSEMIQSVWRNWTGKYKIQTGMISETIENLNLIRGLAQSGNIRAVIDRIYPLEEMREAHRYVEAGHKKGNVVIEVLRQKG